MESLPPGMSVWEGVRVNLAANGGRPRLSLRTGGRVGTAPSPPAQYSQCPSTPRALPPPTRGCIPNQPPPLPPEFATALATGKVSAEVLQRYISLTSGLAAPLMRLPGFRDRLLADPGFLVKLAIEVGIGIFTKSTAEYAKRGSNFSGELDFVAANVAMALVADFMLVWLPAPSLSFACVALDGVEGWVGPGAGLGGGRSPRWPRPEECPPHLLWARGSGHHPHTTQPLPPTPHPPNPPLPSPKPTAATNAVSAFFRSCPENAFQKVQAGRPPFSAAQRGGAVLRNGAKLLGVGFGASLLGVSATNGIIAIRQAGGGIESGGRACWGVLWDCRERPRECTGSYSTAPQLSHPTPSLPFQMLDPGWAPPNAPQDVLTLSAAYASYMAVSSNLRYQLIAGVVEERGIEVLFKSNPAACAALSFVVRTGNTFLGSLLWVDYLRLLGLQKAPGA